MRDALECGGPFGANGGGFDGASFVEFLTSGFNRAQRDGF